MATEKTFKPTPYKLRSGHVMARDRKAKLRVYTPHKDFYCEDCGSGPHTLMASWEAGNKKITRLCIPCAEKDADRVASSQGRSSPAQTSPSAPLRGQ